VNRAEAIDVAIKFGDEPDCFGFTNTSYFHPDLKDPAWHLPHPHERYQVKVSVYTDSDQFCQMFLLRNDWPRPDFCLQNDG